MASTVKLAQLNAIFDWKSNLTVMRLLRLFEISNHGPFCAVIKLHILPNLCVVVYTLGQLVCVQTII